MPRPPRKPNTIPAGQFKAQCLALMDRVARTGEEVVVTKRNRPIAKLVPVYAPVSPRPLFGRSRGRMRVVGEIVAPVHPDWELGEDY